MHLLSIFSPAFVAPGRPTIDQVVDHILLRRHFADVDVCKILGANFLRVFRGVLGVPSPLPG